MHLSVLLIRRFRNLGEVLLSPHPRFNVLHGDNGQGKTNLLEAIYVLATLRSFRTGRIDEMIQFQEEASQLSARVERHGVTRTLQVEFSQRQKRKQALVDGKPASAGEYFGGMNAVLFATDDLQLPKGPPAQRRRFLDRAVWNTCPSYLKEVQTYERVLKSRNALLRQEAEGAKNPGLLDVYDEQMAQSGAVLMARRSGYLSGLAPQVAEAFAQVSRSGLEIALRYRPSAPAPAASADAYRQALAEALLKDRRRDLLRGYTHSGPHADDIDLLLSGRPAAMHASQGQVRALILSLKIAEIRHLIATLADAPVLLLDDVSSELDPQRNAYLFEFLRQVPAQTFITTTDPAFIRLSGDRQDFTVRGGAITPDTPD